ncbi:MAG: aminopeptidase P family protein [Planctomycetota bacterium]
MKSETYGRRRDGLRELAGEGWLLFPAALPVPRNYLANVYPFRQNSHFLYLTGIQLPGIVLAVGAGGDVLFGPPEDLDDVVWHGPHPTLAELGAAAGVSEVRDIAELPRRLADFEAGGAPVRYLPPFNGDSRLQLARLLGRAVEEVDLGASPELARAICALREVKDADEIAEIEDALAVTAEMHHLAMNLARDGVHEAEIAAATQRVALAKGRQQAYNPIISVRGEVLHNNHYVNPLRPGQLLLNDSGAESPLGYASDITRTTPVGGRFSPRQRDVYEIVLDAQLAAIEAAHPGVAYRDLHVLACLKIAQGLIDLGLMKGNAQDAAAAGAHALFFPHGLGHQLGLDVHDMEDLGDVVGYGAEGRSDQFGLNFLRLARPLAPGWVFTVEPGIYFIPALIERWREEGRHRDFIAYDRLEDWLDFGGIRIEDDVLCTESGARVLGPGIAKTVTEVEARANA